MEPTFGERTSDILILEDDPAAAKSTADFIASIFPNLILQTTTSLEDCRKIVKEKDFDIVVLDSDLKGLSDIGLIQHLKVKDNEPAVLVVSESINPQMVNEINSIGCHRYVHKLGDWHAQLGPALRQLMRIRKLEEENRRLVAQLTEAKMFLEEKNKRLDEFSATVAHDIRGPLGGVSMKLEYILDKYNDELDVKLHTLIDRAFNSTRRVIDIVQAMYNYAKLGSKAAVMEELNLRELINEVINDMSFDEKLDINIGIGDLPPIWGSADLLRRVFINLIGNAVKYNDKPQIIINIGLDRIVEKTIGTFAEIFVSDNGPGIPREEHQNVFAIFQRGYGQAKDQDGLGVGLSVVRRIVELHYGDVVVQSAKGEGAKFVLSLPSEKLDFLE